MEPATSRARLENKHFEAFRDSHDLPVWLAEAVEGKRAKDVVSPEAELCSKRQRMADGGVTAAPNSTRGEQTLEGGAPEASHQVETKQPLADAHGDSGAAPAAASQVAYDFAQTPRDPLSPPKYIFEDVSPSPIPKWIRSDVSLCMPTP